jgi:hypothetical protein
VFVGPPRRVECEGENLTAGDLSDDEIPAGQALPWDVRLTGGVPVDLGPACLSPVPAWVHAPDVPSDLDSVLKEKLFSEIVKKLLKFIS